MCVCCAVASAVLQIIVAHQVVMIKNLQINILIYIFHCFIHTQYRSIQAMVLT